MSAKYLKFREPSSEDRRVGIDGVFSTRGLVEVVGDANAESRIKPAKAGRGGQKMQWRRRVVRRGEEEGRKWKG